MMWQHYFGFSWDLRREETVEKSFNRTQFRQYDLR